MLVLIYLAVAVPITAAVAFFLDLAFRDHTEGMRGVFIFSQFQDVFIDDVAKG